MPSEGADAALAYAAIKSERDQLQTDNKILQNVRDQAIKERDRLQAEVEQLKANAKAKDSDSDDLLTMAHAENVELQQQLAAQRAEVERLRQQVALLEIWIRKRIWAGHGCDGIYGDDGELQCNNITAHGRPLDFKRMPLQELFELDIRFRMTKAAQLAQTHRHRWERTGEYWATYPPIWHLVCHDCHSISSARNGEEASDIQQLNDTQWKTLIEQINRRHTCQS